MGSKDEVGAVMKQAQAAGAVIVKPAQVRVIFRTPMGTSGEAVWSPALLPKERV